MVSVVDAFNFYRNLNSVEQLKDRKEEQAARDDDRNIVNLLMEQVRISLVPSRLRITQHQVLLSDADLHFASD